MDTESPSLSRAKTPSNRAGQACDRCRRKKIKCDGAFPTCRNCDKGGWICEVSTTLRRRTKVRGFTSDEQKLEQLEAELARCQQKLKLEQEHSAMLQHKLSHRDQLQIPMGPGLLTTGLTESSPAAHASRAQVDDPAYIITHMGRLVRDRRGTGRFAGSTTGIHFVVNTEQELQKTLGLLGGFPESCFRLFLANPLSTRDYRSLSRPSEVLEEVRQLFIHAEEYYCQQVKVFVRDWDAFCPILVPRQLMTDIHHLMNAVHSSTAIEEIDCAVILTLLMILNINGSRGCSGLTEPNSHSHQRLHLANRLLHKVTTQGGIKSLQALVLFALNNQLDGNCLAMTTLNGTLVTLAQSHGLHRHARRFKMKIGEIELRKRLWWWIYVFDCITSAIHGLPTLINDADIDNDMPLDCHLQDLEAADLTHPLPGERTGVFVFIQYITLGRKLSRTLHMLYTTTQRRDGAAKIAGLDLDLRVWNQNLKASGIHFDIGCTSTLALPSGNSHDIEETTLWLQLLANVVTILIHRPGLSFIDTTTEFGDSLRACLNSGSVILSLQEDSKVPRWLWNLSMIGPGTTFQSALLHGYCQSKYRISKPGWVPALEASMSMISKGISILKNNTLNLESCRSPEEAFDYESLLEVIATLQRLQQALTMSVPASGDTTEMIDAQLLDDGASEIFNGQTWSSNALDALNYMTATDWIGETPGPFMEFMDMGESGLLLGGDILPER